MNDLLHGFRICRMREYPELGGRLWEMEHSKTGAQLCWLDRPEQNKTFAIAFQTLPEDSTGVFHILEHSVLCGSDKYPVKDPFVELLKSSVQTFLNAMTMSDRTVFPVSSRNDRDFLNLIEVYLDAVFHPMIYHGPESFLQEGWRYVQEEGELCYQGVVLNEMKGSFASPQTLLDAGMRRLLFPDTCYRFVSGGDPEQIPELRYERFLEAHKRYYHPSNAWISLVGSIDVDAVLQKIDLVLSGFDRRLPEPPVPLQGPIRHAVSTIPYQISPEEPAEERVILAEASILGRFDEREKSFAASILADYLTGDYEAPLKRAVLEAGLAQDFFITMDDSLLQTTFGWQAINTEAERREALEALVRSIVEQVLADGLDRDRLCACFQSFAFRMRDNESDANSRSLSEALSLLGPWMYGGDPAEGLLVEDVLNTLAARQNGPFFAELLRELFLTDRPTASVILVPSATLGEENAAREYARIQVRTAVWTDADWERLTQDTKTLRTWQETPDSPEALASIPRLQLSDLNPVPELLITDSAKRQGIPVRRHTTGSELAYLKAYFEVSDLSLEELPALTMLCSILGNLGTGKHSAGALAEAVKGTIGRLEFAPIAFAGSQPDSCRVVFSASLACLKGQAESAARLLTEILNETDFSGTETLEELLQQTVVGLRLSLPEEGSRYGSLRVLSCCTSQGAAREALSGLSFLEWAERTLDSGTEGLERLILFMQKLLARIITRERLTVSCSEAIPDEALDVLIGSIGSDGITPKQEVSFPIREQKQEGVSIPSQVGYAVMGTNLLLHGQVFTGGLPVLCKLLTYTHLWNEIRVKGGAYGCGLDGRNNGDLLFYTYRDPQPEQSLHVIEIAGQFLKNYLSGNPDLTGFILSAVSELDPLRNPEQRIAASDARFFSGIPEDRFLMYYRQLLRTTPEDLLALTRVLHDLVSDRLICVVAGDSSISACKNQIPSLETLPW